MDSSDPPKPLTVEVWENFIHPGLDTNLEPLENADIFDSVIGEMSKHELWGGSPSMEKYRDALFPENLRKEFGSENPFDLEKAESWVNHAPYLFFHLFMRDQGPQLIDENDLKTISVAQVLYYKAFLLPYDLFDHPAFDVDIIDKWMNIRHFRLWLQSKYDCPEEARQKDVFIINASIWDVKQAIPPESVWRGLPASNKWEYIFDIFVVGATGVGQGSDYRFEDIDSYDRSTTTAWMHHAKQDPGGGADSIKREHSGDFSQVKRESSED